jgi:hypothetical protein
MNKILVCAALTAASQMAFAANDLMLTSAQSRAGYVTAVDLVSEGNATMVQFRVKVGAVDAKAVDLSACATNLPKSHRGECHFRNGEVVGMVYNDEGVALAAGVVNLGKITVRGAATEPTLSEFLAADRSNAPVHGSIRQEAKK